MDRKLLRSHLNFEVLTRLFFDLADERYPSADKMTQMTSKIVEAMPLIDEYEILHLKIAVLTAMRNMVKEVAPNHLYRSLQHRDELQAAIVEAIEKLDDELEEMQEQMMAEEEEED